MPGFRLMAILSAVLFSVTTKKGGRGVGRREGSAFVVRIVPEKRQKNSWLYRQLAFVVEL
jgi:hypothetical protein